MSIIITVLYRLGFHEQVQVTSELLSSLPPSEGLALSFVHFSPRLMACRSFTSIARLLSCLATWRYWTFPKSCCFCCSLARSDANVVERLASICPSVVGQRAELSSKKMSKLRHANQEDHRHSSVLFALFVRPRHLGGVQSNMQPWQN